MSSGYARGARIWAYAVLAWGLVVHLVKRLFHRGHRGLEHFNAQYAADRLLPALVGDHAVLVAAGRCINCGLCDALCPVTATAPRHEFAGPSIAPLLLSRSASFAAVGGPFLKHAGRCETCIECEQACPTGVPIARVVRLVRRRAASLASSISP